MIIHCSKRFTYYPPNSSTTNGKFYMFFFFFTAQGPSQKWKWLKMNQSRLKLPLTFKWLSPKHIPNQSR